MFHNLEIELARARLTQGKLAELLGITPTTMSLKLNGKSKISLKECTDIKKALGTEESLDYLFATDDPEEKE